MKHGLSSNIWRTEIGTSLLRDCRAGTDRLIDIKDCPLERTGFEKPRDPSDLLTLGSVDQPKVDPKLVAGLACTALQKTDFICLLMRSTDQGRRGVIVGWRD